MRKKTEECQKLFETSQEMKKTTCVQKTFKRHEKDHTEENPYRCKECKKNFYGAGELKRHERVHSGEKPFSCKTCEKAFSRLDALKTHERLHAGEKPFSCKICEKTFSRLDNLKTHERLHSGEKLFSCKTCEKTFSRLHTLKTHERLHSGEKPFSCKTCEKAFSRLHTLKTHERLHSGEKQFSCKICKKAFFSLNCLKLHERVHSGEKLFSCKLCKKKFNILNALKLHERTLHSTLNSGSVKLKKHIMKEHKAEKLQHETTNRNQKPLFQEKNIGEKPIKCSQCNKTFSNTNELKLHKKWHIGREQMSSNKTVSKLINKKLERRAENICEKVNERGRAVIDNTEENQKIDGGLDNTIGKAVCSKCSFCNIVCPRKTKKCKEKVLHSLSEEPNKCDQGRKKDSVKRHKSKVHRLIKAQKSDSKSRAGSSFSKGSRNSDPDTSNFKEDVAMKKYFACCGCKMLFTNIGCLIAHIMNHPVEILIRSMQPVVKLDRLNVL